jgi:hypothetical protein
MLLGGIGFVATAHASEVPSPTARFHKYQFNQYDIEISGHQVPAIDRLPVFG